MKQLRKNNESNEVIKLSDKSIEFLKKYIIKSDTVKFNDDSFYELYLLIFEYETLPASKELNPNFEYDEELAKGAFDFINEVSLYEVDLDDLNERLELL